MAISTTLHSIFVRMHTLHVQYSSGGRTGGDSQLVGKKMKVQRTGERVVVVLMSAALSPRSVGGELRSAWSSGRAIDTSEWMSEGKRPHVLSCCTPTYAHCHER